MEEVNEFTEPIASTDISREPEDVLDNHQTRSGAAKKAPNPLTVAQFREGLESLGNTAAGANFITVSASIILKRLCY